MSDEIGELVGRAFVNEFLQSYWGKKIYYRKGSPGDFDHLFSWNDVNLILQSHRLGGRRLKVISEKTFVAPSEYISDPAMLAKQLERLDVKKIYGFLARGATLIIDDVTEIVPRLSALANSLMSSFLTGVNANAYVSFGNTRGFGLHWDDHDVIILQISGRKKWKVYEPSVPFPMYRNKNSDAPPIGKPVWEGMLKSGSVLYIPRGYWHDVVGMKEKTLHLTVSVKAKTGMSVAHWLVDELKSDVFFRKDVPIFSSTTEKASWVSEFRSKIQGHLSGDLYGQFYGALSSTFGSRVAFSFPGAIEQTANFLKPETLVGFMGILVPGTRDKESTFAFKFRSEEWEFPLAAKDMILALFERQRSISDLVLLANGASLEDVIDFVCSNIFDGLFYIVPQRGLEIDGGVLLPCTSNLGRLRARDPQGSVKDVKTDG